MDPKYLALVTRKMEQLLTQKDAPIFQLVSRKAVGEMLQSEPLWPWYGQLMRLPQTIAYLLQVNTWLVQNNIDVLL